MPTPKQVRHHYKKCRRYLWLLQRALNDAHNADVIDYRPRSINSNDPALLSVCSSIGEAKIRFEKATEQARADAFKSECMSELKDVY
jgi:hypothetical protein